MMMRVSESECVRAALAASATGRDPSRTAHEQFRSLPYKAAAPKGPAFCFLNYFTVLGVPAMESTITLDYTMEGNDRRRDS